ncbi:hypothetical protein M1E11_16180 [Bacillus sp. JZ8]
MKKFYVWEKGAIDMGSLVNDNKKKNVFFSFFREREKRPNFQKKEKIIIKNRPL